MATIEDFDGYLWILVSGDESYDRRSIDKLCEFFIQRKFLNYHIVKQEDIVYKMSTDGLETYVHGMKVVHYPSVIYCRIHSDVLKPDVQIPLLRHFELLGVRIVNSVDAILKTTNKIWHFLELAKAGIPIPLTLSYCSDKLDSYTPPEEGGLSYPLICKSVRGNKGNKVFMINTDTMRKELEGVLQHDVPYLYQEYICESHGRDMRVIVVDGKAVCSVIRQSDSDTVCSQKGEGIVVTGRFEEAESLACKIAKVLGADICGVDLLLKDDVGFVCCEVNNTPSFSKFIYDEHEVENHIGEYLFKIMGIKKHMYIS